MSEMNLAVFSQCKLHKTSLEISPSISREEYLKLGECLHLMQGSLQFWIGDWVRFGEKKWGEMYKEAQEATGLDYGTLRRFKSISTSVPLLLRNNNLSFNHHEVVAPLKPEQQKEWLDKAEKEGLSYRDLKEEIKSSAYKKSLLAAQSLINEKKRQYLDYICALKVCSCAELFTTGIKPNAVITDPPYPKEFLYTFSELSLAAKEVPLVAVMSGQSNFPEVLKRLCEHLKYRWLNAYLTPGAAYQSFQSKMISNWKPVILFGETNEWLTDIQTSESRDKMSHEWGQSESGMADLIETLTKPGDLICDPFVGGGTTALVALKLGRRFIGCDIDKEAIETTRARVEAWAATK